MGSTRMMPLLRFLGALFSHVSCNEATFPKYMLQYLDRYSVAKLERVSDVALLGVGSNYI